MEADNSSFWSRHEFLILRLHSLTGLVPVGAYMVVHLITNASVLESPAKYQSMVYGIHGLGAILPVVEWVFIFIPILFHAIIGMVIIGGGLPNTTTYRYSGNFRYTLQRWTGVIAFLFIGWHVFHMHGWIHADWWIENVAKPGFGAQFRPYNAASTAGEAMRPGGASTFVVVVLYIIGVLASVFHLANGIWTAGITWGVWISPKAQVRALRVCGVFGVLLAAASMGALWGMYTVDVEQAREVENRMLEAKVEAGLVTEEEALHKQASSGETYHDDNDESVTSTKTASP